MSEKERIEPVLGDYKNILEDEDVVDEDWLNGVSCNTDDPEECEACQ